MIEMNKIYNEEFLSHSTKNIDNESIDLIITDSPWGADAWDKGNYNDDEDFIKEKIPLWLNEYHRVLKENCHIYLFVPTKFICNWLIPFKELFKFNNILSVENMKNGKQYPNKFRNNQQMILYGSKGKAKNFNKSDFIKTSDVWFKDKRNPNPKEFNYSYPAFLPSYIKATVEHSYEFTTEDGRSIKHSDEKNVKLIKHLIEISSNEEDVVADFFIG